MTTLTGMDIFFQKKHTFFLTGAPVSLILILGLLDLFSMRFKVVHNNSETTLPKKETPRLFNLN